MSMSIGERRAVAKRAAEDFDFRTLLKAKPAEAVAQVIGRPVAEPIDVIEEGENWDFVLVDAAAIEADLPEAEDALSAMENQAYEVLRDDPAARDKAAESPKDFVRDYLKFQVDADQQLTFHHEAPGRIALVIPNRDEREALDDELLDLVAGALGGGETDEERARRDPNNRILPDSFKG